MDKNIIDHILASITAVVEKVTISEGAISIVGIIVTVI